MDLKDQAKLQEIIKRYHLKYAIDTLGLKGLTDGEREILYQLGYRPEEDEEISDFDRAFRWGMYSARLREAEAREMEPKVFRGIDRHIALSFQEKATLGVIKRQSYNRVAGLGQVVYRDVSYKVGADRYRASLTEALGGVVKKEIWLPQAVTKLGKETKDWERDLGRLVDTEYHIAQQTGRLIGIEKERGKGTQVYKDVFPGACRYCIKLYTTRGIGSEPRLFSMNELKENGSDNVGRKANDWKPVVGATHPFCRCNLRYKRKNTVWDKERKGYRIKRRER